MIDSTSPVRFVICGVGHIGRHAALVARHPGAALAALINVRAKLRPGLVVRFVFSYKVIQVKWFGTHREYDQVEVATVQYRPI